MTVTLPPLSTIQPKDVYNCIMIQIEPDLVTTNIKSLHTKYANETEAEKQHRIERYAQARAQYKQELEAYLQQSSAEISQEQKAALDSIEQESRANEQAQLDLLENYFKS